MDFWAKFCPPSSDKHVLNTIFLYVGVLLCCKNVPMCGSSDVLWSLFFMEVVEKLIRGLAMENSRNMFALFEHNDATEKAIESRTVVADVLAKFEK